MTNIQTNTSLESVLDNKQDQLKLRDFNDLKKEDVITNAQKLIASKYANDIYFEFYASGNAEITHYALSKDQIDKIKSNYEDKDSKEYDYIANELADDLHANAEDQIDVDSKCNVEVEIDVKEVSVDSLVRKKFQNSSVCEDLLDPFDANIDENRKIKVLNDLNIDKDEYSVELVSKDNVPTFVIIKKDKSIKDQIESIRDSLNFNFSDSLKSFKKIDEVMLELYDDERSIYESLKIFLERFDKEVNKDVLVFQEEDIVDDLRKLFKTLESQSENTSQ